MRWGITSSLGVACLDIYEVNMASTSEALMVRCAGGDT